MKLTDVDSSVNEGVMDYLKANPWYHVGSALVGHAPNASARTAQDLMARDNFISTFVKTAIQLLTKQAETVRDAIDQQKALDAQEDEERVKAQVQADAQKGVQDSPTQINAIRQKIKAARERMQSTFKEGFEGQLQALLEAQIPQAQPKYISDIMKEFLAKYLKSTLGNIAPYQNQLFPFCDQIGVAFVKGQAYQGILENLGETIYNLISTNKFNQETAKVNKLFHGNPELLTLIKQIQQIKRATDLDQIIKAAQEQRKLAY